MNDVLKHKLKKRTYQTIISLLRYLFILGICFVILYPLFSKVVNSFMVVGDIYDETVRLIPTQFTLINYERAWELMNLSITLPNSIFLCVIVSLIQVFFCTIVAYGFARFDFKFKNFLFFMVILSLIILPDATLLSRFLQFRYFDIFGIFKLLMGQPLDFGTGYIPFIIMAITTTGLKNGLYIFMMRQYFRGMPKELEEAAYVDGCGPFKTFARIMVPSAVSMMVTIFLLSFVWQWLDSTNTTVFMNAKVIPVEVNKLIGQANPQWGLVDGELLMSLARNAGIVLVTLPLIIVYVFAQRFFVQSISRTGIVG